MNESEPHQTSSNNTNGLQPKQPGNIKIPVYKEWWFVAITVIVICAIGIGINNYIANIRSNNTAAAQSSVKNSTIDTESDPKEDKTIQTNGTLGMTVSEFKQKYNNHVTEMGFEYLKISSEKQSVDVLSTQLSVNENIGFLVSIDNETQLITDVMMNGTGDGTQQSGANIILSMSFTIDIIDSEMSIEKRNEVVNALMKTSETGKAEEINYNGYSYRANFSEAFGLLFHVSNKDTEG